MSKLEKPADLRGLYPAAIRESLVKLDPRRLWRNPVMFVTAVVAAMTTVLGLRDLMAGAAGVGTSLHISAWRGCACFLQFRRGAGRGAAGAGGYAAGDQAETRCASVGGGGQPRAGDGGSVPALRPGQMSMSRRGEIIPTMGGGARTGSVMKRESRARARR